MQKVHASLYAPAPGYIVYTPAHGYIVYTLQLQSYIFSVTVMLFVLHHSIIEKYFVIRAAAS